MEYFILSLKHTRAAHRVLTWWRPNNSDYCYRLEWAGRYTAEQVAAEPHYYDNGWSARAVPCDVVLALAAEVSTVASRFLDAPSETKPGTDHVVEHRHIRSLRRAHRSAA